MWAPPVWWLAGGLALVLLELAVPGVLVLFFGVGAWGVALLLAVAPGLPVWGQVTAWLVLSLLALAVGRRFLPNAFRGRRLAGPGDIDLSLQFVGERAVAATAFGGDGHAGHVEFRGSTWPATSSVPVAAGTELRVVGRDGLTLQVTPA
ncbi:MAG: NfeD family protein [Gemmatimonadetes bacterium]|nr:NfeD family protein [Gemmatimonadota bacterium]